MRNNNIKLQLLGVCLAATFYSCNEEALTTEFDPYEPSIDDISNEAHPLPYDNNGYGLALINDWSVLEYFAHQDFTEITSYKMTGGFAQENPQFADRLNLFPDLRKIGGNLIVDVGYISNFDGFWNLDTISGVLQLKNVPHMNSLEGFESLDYIGGGLYLYNTDSLVSLKGLEKATLEGEYIYIKRLDKLESFEHFPTANALTGGVTISENPKLYSLQGLETLKTVQGGFSINKNVSLKDLQGLEGLTSIDGDLKIINCDALESIQGLKNLHYVGGDIIFTGNALVNSWDYSFLPKEPMINY